MRIPADRLTLHHHCGFHDHPLNGVCVINGEWWWFEREYGSRWAECRRMSRAEKTRSAYRHLVFRAFVGSHTTYQGNERPRFGSRRPRWFWRRAASVYYRGLIGIIKPIF